MSHRTISILGLPVACATYESACDASRDLATRPRPTAVSASNTHIASASRGSEEFAKVMNEFDLVLPDGTPLKWILNFAGARLPDRVYGPYFMRYMLEHTPRPWKHFLFGGSEECLAKLRTRFSNFNAEIDIVGTYSPPFGDWGEEDNQRFAEIIAEHDPDFIWVALGVERQEKWIIANRHRFKRGVFFAVGDAFELLAGSRPFAPHWMQRAGLTWLYRLMQEPGRLWPRYFKYNSRFLLQFASDSINPRRHAFFRMKPSVAFLGSRGTPARYAGFETVVEELGSRLARRNYTVTVYNRRSYYEEKPATYRDMRLVYLPSITTKKLETIVNSTLATIHALFQRYDIVYLCGVGNAPMALPLRLLGKKVIINVDGIDYKRSKWTGFARQWLHNSERWAIRFAHHVIADNKDVVRHYEESYQHTPTYITYGSSANTSPINDGQLAKWNLTARNYILIVSRLSPENQIADLLKAHAELNSELPLVVVGPVGYETKYFAHLQSLAASNVVFTGPIYGDGYRELSQNCLLFVLPAAIEATRLVLLDQMGFGNAILFRESTATREVIGDAGEPFDDGCPETTLATKLQALTNDPARCSELGHKALQRVHDEYDWERVTDRYEAMLLTMHGTAVDLQAPTPD